MIQLLRRILTYGMLSFLFIFAVAAIVLVTNGLSDQLEYGDVIVVPGNTIQPDGTPSPRLKARLDAALNLYRKNFAPIIFVSGGTGKEGFDEADSMAHYLIENGVPSNFIVRDPNGINTDTTARNLAAYMHKHKLHNALVATQYFHIPRTKLALMRYGIPVKGYFHANYFELRDLYSIPREVIAYATYLVRNLPMPLICSSAVLSEALKENNTLTKLDHDD